MTTNNITNVSVNITIRSLVVLNGINIGHRPLNGQSPII